MQDTKSGKGPLKRQSLFQFKALDVFFGSLSLNDVVPF